MIRWERALVTAALILTVACLAFGYTLVRAVVIESTRPARVEPASETSGSKAALAPSKGKSPSRVAGSIAAGEEEPAKAAEAQPLRQSDLMLAVEHDPFQADRQRVAERYRMPGEEEVVEEPPPPPPPPPPFKVLGTIVTSQGGVAVIETQTGSRVVGVGEALFGFTLTSVNAANATVEGNGGRQYSLQIEEPALRRTGRGNAARGARPPQETPRGLMETPQGQMMMEEIMRARANGADPQMLQQAMEALQRMMPNGRGRGIGSVEVVRGANGQQQMIIRPRPDTTSS